MQAEIVVLPGDGIGPEVTAAAVQVLRAVGQRYGHEFHFTRELIGGAAIDATGEPLPSRTLDAAKRADAVLLGAVGGRSGRIRARRCDRNRASSRSVRRSACTPTCAR